MNAPLPRLPRIDTEEPFVVDARFQFSGEAPQTKDAVNAWILAWMGNHANRLWRGCGSGRTTPSFFADFTSVPTARIENDNLVIRFYGKKSSTQWKDWLMTITRALVAECNEIPRLIGFESPQPVSASN